MIEEEDESRKSPDQEALRETSSRCSPNFVWREKVSQWCYDVVDHINESRDVVYLAMNVLDRYCIVQSGSLTEREYEISALVALFLAVRISGSAALELPQVIRMSQCGARLSEILATGNRMTECLSWERKLHTPLQYCKAMMDLADLSPCLKTSILESACYLVEVSVCDAFFSGTHPFLVAYAAVSNSIGTGPQSRVAEPGRSVYLHRLLHLWKGDQDQISSQQLRLHHVYSQSEENRDSCPHVVPDDDDGNDRAAWVGPIVPPFGIRVVSSQRFIPSSPITTCTPPPIKQVQESSSIKRQQEPNERAVSPTPSKIL